MALRQDRARHGVGLRWLGSEVAVDGLPRRPADPVEQLRRIAFERGGELDQGVDAGDAQPSLQLGDLGAV